MNWHILSKNYISSQCQQIGSTIYCHASLQKIWLPLPPFRDFRFVWVWKSAQPFKSSSHFLAILNIYNLLSKNCYFWKNFINHCIFKHMHLGYKEQMYCFLAFFLLAWRIFKALQTPPLPSLKIFFENSQIFFKNVKFPSKTLIFFLESQIYFFFKF